jgi:branched-chain amino acid transport system substrate-binding protein
MKLKYASIAALLAAALASPTALAQKTIKIGNTNPYSGPASAYGSIGKSISAYWKMVNDHGGINGRKVEFISYDDGYSPPKTVEMVRRLVEQDEVLLVFQSLGTPTNSAIHKYMNAKKVPHLFVATGATKWNDPKHYRWTMGWQPNYQTEGRIYAEHILKNNPKAKIGILYQNDDYGKDYVKGFRDGLGSHVNMIVKEVSYEVADPTIDSQMVQLQASGADTFFNVTTPKFAAQAIRKAYDSGWKPTHYLNNVSNSIRSVLTPAGLEKSVGLITTGYIKDPNDAQWKDDPAIKEWQAFVEKYLPGANLPPAFTAYGYAVSQTLHQVLKQCGSDLSRANIIKQAENLKNFRPELLLPGIRINTSPTDHAPIESEQLARFDGEKWQRFGPIIGKYPSGRSRNAGRARCARPFAFQGPAVD